MALIDRTKAKLLAELLFELEEPTRGEDGSYHFDLGDIIMSFEADTTFKALGVDHFGVVYFCHADMEAHRLGTGDPTRATDYETEEVNRALDYIIGVLQKEAAFY